MRASLFSDVNRAAAQKWLLPGRVLLIPALLILIASCASSPSSVALKNLSSPGECYLKEYGGPPVSSIEYRLTEDRAVTRTTDNFSSLPPFSQRTTEKRLATAEVYQRFQQRLRALKVEQWKAIYKPDSFICDGGGWELRYQTTHKTIDSSGDNAGPDLRNPKKTISADENSATGDEALRQAMDELWKHSHRAL